MKSSSVGRAGAEHVRPRARSSALPRRATRRAAPARARLACREVFRQLARARARRTGASALGGVIARGRDHPDLVLDLHHQRPCAAVPSAVAEVPHQRGERARVRVAVRGRERREDLLRRAVERRSLRGKRRLIASSPTPARTTTCCSSSCRTRAARAACRSRARRRSAGRRGRSRTALLRLDEVPVDRARTVLSCSARSVGHSGREVLQGSTPSSCRARRRGSGTACRRRRAAWRCPAGAGGASTGLLPAPVPRGGRG